MIDLKRGVKRWKEWVVQLRYDLPLNACSMNLWQLKTESLYLEIENIASECSYSWCDWCMHKLNWLSSFLNLVETETGGKVHRSGSTTDQEAEEPCSVTQKSWRSISHICIFCTLFRFNIMDFSIAFMANNSPEPCSSTRWTLQKYRKTWEWKCHKSFRRKETKHWWWGLQIVIRWTAWKEKIAVPSSVTAA